MEEKSSGKIQICTVLCRIIIWSLLSIYLSNYSVANFYGFIQKCSIVCVKKAFSCSFSWALEWDWGFWQYCRCQRNKSGDSGIPFRVFYPQTFLMVRSFCFTDAWSTVLYIGLSADSISNSSSGISGFASSPYSGWPDKASFPVYCYLWTRFL